MKTKRSDNAQSAEEEITALINQKGGVSKAEITAILRRYQILLVDRLTLIARCGAIEGLDAKLYSAKTLPKSYQDHGDILQVTSLELKTADGSVYIIEKGGIPFQIIVPVVPSH